MNTLSKLTLAAALALSAATTTTTLANEAGAANQSPQGAASTSKSEGEIKKIDKQAGKLTIKHDALKNLQMPPMTMVFQVNDSAMLDRVKVGDKIRFIDGKTGAQFTAAQLEVKQ